MSQTMRSTQGQTWAGHTDLETTVCTCGVLFAIPEKMLDSKRETGSAFFCPNGHSLVFKNYENAKLKQELASAKDSLASATARADQTEASLRATKGVVTKQRTKLDRVAKGVCPECNRSFADLRKHMETKHSC